MYQVSPFLPLRLNMPMSVLGQSVWYYVLHYFTLSGFPSRKICVTLFHYGGKTSWKKIFGLHHSPSRSGIESFFGWSGRGGRAVPRSNGSNHPPGRTNCKAEKNRGFLRCDSSEEDFLITAATSFWIFFSVFLDLISTHSNFLCFVQDACVGADLNNCLIFSPRRYVIPSVSSLERGEASLRVAMPSFELRYTLSSTGSLVCLEIPWRHGYIY